MMMMNIAIRMMMSIATMMLMPLNQIMMTGDKKEPVLSGSPILVEVNGDFAVGVKIRTFVVQPSPGDEKYFKGGEITRMYGSRDGGQVPKK